MKYQKLIVLLLACLCGLGSLCFARLPEGRYDNDNGASKKAYYDKMKSTEASLKKDSDFVKLVQAYDIFKKYAVEIRTTRFDMEAFRQLNWDEESIEIPKDGDPVDYALGGRVWVVRMGDSIKQAKVVDSVNTLNHPFFERIHQRSEKVCKNRVLNNDTLKELSDVLLAWYLKNGKKDYFVEKTEIYYTTKPCVMEDVDDYVDLIGRTVQECRNKFEDYQKIDTLCVDTKGLDFKRMFLTNEDEEALDVFSGCDRWTGSMKVEDDRYNKNGFLPFEIGYNSVDMCFDYGPYIGRINLDLENGKATVESGLAAYNFKKIDGVWKYVDFSVDGFIN
ncbi:MAG: hypothetical protein MJY93_10400 [Fibrobacter sp.]|nr:hypothetical protein [Fibrobacter sp.]